MHVGLAEQDRAGGLQFRQNRRVRRRNPVLQRGRSGGRRQAGCGNVVLDDDRHAGKRARGLALSYRCIRRLGRGQRAVTVQRDEGMAGFVRLCLGDKRLDEVFRGDLAVCDGLGGLACGQAGEIVRRKGGCGGKRQGQDGRLESGFHGFPLLSGFPERS